MNFYFEFLYQLSMLWEAISNTQKSISLDIQTLSSWLKKLSYTSFFQTHFSVFGYMKKHSSFCWYMYITWKFGFIKQVDKGPITTVGDLESLYFKH